jgi:hypothetical protein
MMSGLAKAAQASRRQLRGVKRIANAFRKVAADRIGTDKRGVLIGMHAAVEMRGSEPHRTGARWCLCQTIAPHRGLGPIASLEDFTGVVGLGRSRSS